MGGIISGFLSGAGKGMAQAGQMMFADKIAKEREEANFLRDSALKGSMATEEREFKSSEAEKRDAAAMERTKYTADTKASLKSGDTTNIKDAAALRKLGYPGEVADAVAHGAFKQIKDEDTGDMVLINALTNKPVGRLTTINNKKQWLPEGEEPELAEVTAQHRKTAKKTAGEKAGWFSTDVADFPSTEGDRKAWTKKESQRLAQEERKAKKGGGIIGGKMPKTPEKEVKTIGAKQLSKQEYIDAMVKKYGKDKLSIIEKQWSAYK